MGRLLSDFFFPPAIFLSKCLFWLCILAPSVSHYPAILRVFFSILAHSNVPPPKQCIVPRPQQRHPLPTILRCLEEGGNKDFKYDATWNPPPWVLKLKPGFYWLRIMWYCTFSTKWTMVIISKYISFNCKHCLSTPKGLRSWGMVKQ